MLKQPRGKLFYVIGPSGAGKDSLIDYAKRHGTPERIKFVRRYITRAANAGFERHIEVTRAGFQAKLEERFFALWWESHGNYYGISAVIDEWMEMGYNVVMNGSRGYLPKAIERYPDLVAVLVEVSPEVLRNRLHNRGRETSEQIEKRIQRSRQFDNLTAPNLVRINNDVALELSGARFIEIISGS